MIRTLTIANVLAGLVLLFLVALFARDANAQNPPPPIQKDAAKKLIKQKAQEVPTHREVVGQVQGVQIKGGKLTEPEEELLRRLDEMMIPLPDTIVVTNFAYAEKGKAGKGWVQLFKPNTVYLSPTRGIHPDRTFSRYPYLYGRKSVPTPKVEDENQEAEYPRPFGAPYTQAREEEETEPDVEQKKRLRVHILAHEIGHVLAPRLNAELGRPALGVLTATQEVQAEIIGLMLMDQAFGRTSEELGFPDVVEYRAPSVEDKSVKQLRWQYCVIAKSTWKLTGMQCERPDPASSLTE